MSEETIYTPQSTAEQLDVSPATLRRWSQRFGDFLSAEATATSEQGRSHRRYTDEDLTTLRIVKELMNNGMTYEQVHQHLTNHFMVAPETDSPSSGFAEEIMAEAEEKGLIVAGDSEPAIAAFLTNTLTTLAESQQSILNSQAANRELMGVLIQDNFNLKEENNRLRERILEVERNVAQGRQEQEWQRESLRQELEGKISMAQQTATQAITTAQSTPAPEIKAVKSKPGCLGSLLGGGDIQIFSVPGREKRADGRPVAAHPSPAPQRQQAPRSHPKPTAPPE